MNVEEFLEHYGVRGMHWGIRRFNGGSGSTGVSRKVSSGGRPAWQSKPPSRSPAAVGSAKLSRKQQKLAAKQPSHDALEIAAIRQKVKKHGKSSLTNEDLQKIAKRVELQQKYDKAYPKKPSKLALTGKAAVAAALTQVGRRKIVNIIPDPYQANQVHDLLKTLAPKYGAAGILKKSLDKK